MPKINRQNSVRTLVNAAAKTWRAYMNFGPVDDGTKKGEEFTTALDKLMEAIAEIKVDPKGEYTPELIIRYRWIRTPGGRGANTGRWQATDTSEWIQYQTGRTEYEAIGKVLMAYFQLGKLPPKVVLQSEPESVS